ncbi:MAG: hypothetical protein ACE5FT_07925, partial [Candidatus Nanoarchaeia archaeon]
PSIHDYRFWSELFVASTALFVSAFLPIISTPSIVKKISTSRDRSTSESYAISKSIFSLIQVFLVLYYALVNAKLSFIILGVNQI